MFDAVLYRGTEGENAKRWRPIRAALAVASATLLTACASKQLNFNTQDIAASVSKVYLQEVLDNFGRTIGDPTSLPSQVDILAGTAQTSNSITPNISFPLSNMFAAAIGTTTTRTTTTAGASLSIPAADAWQQNWNITTVSDALLLRNLQALYRHEIVQEELSNPGQPNSVPNVEGTRLMKEYTVPRHYDYSVNLTADPFFLLYPQCVICVANEQALSQPNAPRFVNPDLLGTGWLFWKTSDGSFKSKTTTAPANAPNMVSLGTHEGYDLYVEKDDLFRLSQFVFFILPVSEPIPPSGAKPATPAEAPKNPKRPTAEHAIPAAPPRGLGGGPAANPRVSPFLFTTPFGIQPQGQ